LYPNGNVECIYEDIRFPNLDDALGMYNALMKALTETKVFSTFEHVRIKIHDPSSTRWFIRAAALRYM